MSMEYIWNCNTIIETDIQSRPVQNAVGILYRDMRKVFQKSREAGGTIRLRQLEIRQRKAEGKEKTALLTLKAEQYQIEITGQEIIISASSDLGFVYGLLYLSEKYLGILPFWFWMDQKIEKKERIAIPCGRYLSPKSAVAYRGWFFNDEVLMMKWKYNENGMDGWKMAFEALLRCGGNMAIPGTDKMAEKNRRLAADMGLWITHHHAEPLGAELFSRVYPDIPANYMQHPDKFEQLWEDAVIAQKEYKVVWNVCFRGQGDTPFWDSDTSGAFDTPEKRGRLISELIKKQCDIVRKYVKDPVFCTNLYGEIMELYEQGVVELDPDIIKIRADNGFGKMVTRRQGNHNPRINAMPDQTDSGAQGIYYHVSFYDLQAANHITMLPNSVSFVNNELKGVLENGGSDFWVINCSNVRPHVYYLDAIRKIWFGASMIDKTHSEEFAADYYGGSSMVAACYEKYSEYMPVYGEYEDEHAGEQFYTENVRLLARQLLIDVENTESNLKWLTGEMSFARQAARYGRICMTAVEGLRDYQTEGEQILQRLEADHTSARLFEATLLLQIRIHRLGCEGAYLFAQALQAYHEKDYKKGFLLCGKSVECFETAAATLRAAEYDHWDTFYENDCLADIKHTAYMVRKAMGLFRELGDNQWHVSWQREYCYAKEDRNVYLLMITENHMTDWDLYQVMKTKDKST